MKVFTVTLTFRDDSVKESEVESAVRYGLDGDAGMRAGDYLMETKEASE